MCKRINAINRYYKILIYDEINKQEALNKISTLHENLKFKDNDNFSDRFRQTVSVIEKNLSVFKSACNHVDIITTLLNNFYTISIKMIFDQLLVNMNVFNIIYLMFIICEEDKIPLFLKRAIIDNSSLTDIDGLYERLISNYTVEMIVFEDSDLYAVITYLKITPCFLLRVKKIFIQESIKQKFLWLLEKNCRYFSTVNLPIFIFRLTNELFTHCKDFSSCFNMMSIWSENITSAKVLAMQLQNDVIFINAYLEFGTDIQFPLKKKQFIFSNSYPNYDAQPKDGNKINLNIYTENIYTVYNHFYNGTWKEPVSDIYWIHNDDKYAHCTREDVNRCINSAEEAFESWSHMPVRSRIELINNLVNTLECNSKYLLANTISKCIKLLNEVFKPSLSGSNERLEQIYIRAPRGIISLCHTNEVTLFNYLITSLFVGNCVIIVCSQHLCNIAPYCNMFSTSKIPPGVINLIFQKDLHYPTYLSNYSLTNYLMIVTVPKNIILPLK